MIPAHFIRNFSVTIGGKTFVDAEWGGGVAKDPYVSFRARGVKAGDKVVVAYEDNLGNTGSAEATVR